MEGKCEKCGAEIDPKYKFCLKCVEEMKRANAETGAIKGSNADIVSELSKINNNLYALRTMQEFFLKARFGAELVTERETKRFKITLIPGQKRGRKRAKSL